MPIDAILTYLHVPQFALVAARLAGLIMFQPLLSSLAVPSQIRIALVLGLAVLITPMVEMPANVPDTLLTLGLALGQEVILGVLFGLVTVGVFLGMQFAGLLIAQESGLAFGQIADPTLDEEESVLSSFYLQLGAVSYFIIGGHRALVAACLDTFETIPLLGNPMTALNNGGLILDALALSGRMAAQIAIPTILTLFLVNMALGFISRTLPQLNVTTVGFSIKTLLAFAVMAAALPSALGIYLAGLEEVFSWMHEAVGT